jgi:DNA-directed RNA polymerase subunit RPC12/RpoP
MAIVIDRDQGIKSELEDRIGLECPYCGVYAHMQPQSVPEAKTLLRDRPKHVGLVYKCDACNAPVFLRFAVREYQDNKVELYRNFVELERP